MSGNEPPVVTSQWRIRYPKGPRHSAQVALGLLEALCSATGHARGCHVLNTRQPRWWARFVAWAWYASDEWSDWRPL